MSYEVLARKWRPQLFQDVIGQEHITQTLINAIKGGRIAHAYLFAGPRGVGKTSVARILAKAMNCQNGEPGIPCNKCRSCIDITDGSSVDVQEIDGASNRGIDEIRELRENIRYMPSSSRYRIYIIDEVHMLTLPAFNALLKTLEEPPAHVKFIFATTESHKVPITILSRCQRFDFKRIPTAQIISHLGKISQEEGIAISKSGLALIAGEAEGGMRDAESLLDQVVSYAGLQIEDRHITEILGIIDRDLIFETCRAIIEGSPKECLKLIDKVYNYGYNIREYYNTLMEQFRNLMVSLITQEDHLLNMNEIDIKETRRIAQKAGFEKIQVLLNFMITREEDLRFSFCPRLILETTMIKMCYLGELLSFDDLLKKIESLEKRLIGASHSHALPESAQISDPTAPWELEDREKGRAEVEIVSKTDNDWNDFLNYLAGKNKLMFNILKDWKFLSLDEKVLKISKGNQSFSSKYFDDQERYNQISGYCRDFFKSDIKIKIVVNNQPHSETWKEPVKKKQYLRHKTDKNLPPPVRDIIQMFQGKLLEGDSATK